MATSKTTEPNAVWTTRRLLGWIATAIGDAGVESPRLCAEMLVSHVLGCERLALYMDADRPASTQERETLRGLVGRALQHEPVQYLVGEGWFFSLPFTVDRRALVPRPCTETLVDLALRHAKVDRLLAAGTFADVCTGSGCVAVALLKNLPEAHGIACDISSDALSLAAENAKRHSVDDRLELLEGDLLTPVRTQAAAAGKLAGLFANPPYIPDHEWDAVPRNVKDHEPALALRGGADGLDLVRPLLADGPALLASGGMLIVEIAASAAKQVLELANTNAELVDARIEQDLEGLPRMLVAMKR